MKTSSLYTQKIFSLTFLILVSCKTENCLKFGSRANLNNEIIFYNREMSGIDNYDTYDDNLVITNYISKTMRLDFFLTQAKNYLDTAKADRPISSITFLSQSKGGCLPNPERNVEKSRQYYIVQFVYSNVFPENKDKREIQIHVCRFFKNGKESVAYNRSVDNLDSLINRNEIVY